VSGHWGLYRKQDGALEVSYRAFADPLWSRLSTHETKPEALAALKIREENDEKEALRAAGQKELWDEA
jgi:hypothetical protein